MLHLRAKGLALAAFAFAVLGGCGLAACGARGPLDIEVINVVESGDGGDAGNDGLDAKPQSDAGSVAPVDAAPEAAPKEAGLLNCGLCVAQQCGGSILTCVEDTTCRMTLQCAATTCVKGGGAPDLQCVLGCANGDPAGVMDLIGVFECVASTCGSDCTSLIGGLGG